MDSTPEGLENTPDAIPRVEPYARGPNRPYTLFGKTYVPITDNRPYKARGVGSWYGKKWHGNKTASGEVYDMFKMTAAHPTLPIPCYARVTNLATGKQVIVRINDRGPFRADRIIDLSYTAALKLGYLNHGSTLLEVEHLLPDEIARINLARTQQQAATRHDVQQTAKPNIQQTPQAGTQQTPSVRQDAARQDTGTAVAPTALTGTAGKAEYQPLSKAPGYYLQLGAYQQIGNAQAAQAEYILNWAHALPGVELVMTDTYYRLFAGPFPSQEEAAYVAREMESASGSRPLVVMR
jgi:rare lipoprotein A